MTENVNLPWIWLKCLVLLPGQKFCPGHFVQDKKKNVIDIHLPGQNIFCSLQYWNFTGQKFYPGLKSIFYLKSHSRWIFLAENQFSRLFQSGNFILNDFWKQKIDLNLGQNFCPGQKTFSPGRWTRHIAKRLISCYKNSFHMTFSGLKSRISQGRVILK